MTLSVGRAGAIWKGTALKQLARIAAVYTLFNALPPRPKFLFSWSIVMHTSHYFNSSIHDRLVGTSNSRQTASSDKTKGQCNTKLALNNKWTMVLQHCELGLTLCPVLICLLSQKQFFASLQGQFCQMRPASKGQWMPPRPFKIWHGYICF